jgi:acyl-CoA dehydrogenase
MNDDLPFDLDTLAGSVRRFMNERVVPNVAQWEAAGEFPRELYREAGALGILGLGYPEELGGTPAPHAVRNALSVAMARWGASGGVLASLFSHNIGLPPILRHGTEALQQEVIPGVLRGEKIAALAITEPEGGSDVAALRTKARRDGDEWVISGEKVFITSGMRADWITVAVRTGEPGTRGISMLVVPGAAAGLARSRLDKMGWLCSDTAHLRFDDVRVPARYLVGEEGGGFKIIMGNFNGERLAMSALALGFAQACHDEALAWARDRHAFGGPLVEKQVIRHKLVDMQMRISSTEAWLHSVTESADNCADNWRRQLGSDPNCSCLEAGSRPPVDCSGLHAEEPRNPDDAVLRRPGGADPRRHGLHARHEERTHLSRSESDDDRRRGGRDHEGPGRQPAGPMTRHPPALPVAFDDEFVQGLKHIFEEKIVFNQVLGLKIESLRPDQVTGRIAMKPDLVGHYAFNRLHGGVISAGLDAMGGLAVMAAIGARHMDEGPAQRLQRFGKLGTIDLRIDYLRPAIGEHFELRAEVLRLGSRVASTRMEFHGADGKLLASGAGAYIVS